MPMICSEYAHTGGGRIRKGYGMDFPKPLQDRRGQYKVYLHSVPNVGDVFWSLSGVGRDKIVQHFRVVSVKQYKSKLRGGMATMITWEDQNGNVSTSGLRSKSMNKANRQYETSKSINCSDCENA